MAEYSDIICAFRQGLGEGKGNSGPVAVIKAAIEVFGLNGVFTCRQTAGRYHITLRNGAELSFSEQELNHCSFKADFRPIRGQNESHNRQLLEIYDYSLLCFCTMVRRLMQLGDMDTTKNDWNDAIAVLNNGTEVEFLPMLLGITQVNGPQTWMPVKETGGVVAWLGNYAVFASHSYYDYYGETRLIGPMFPNRLQLVG